MSFGTYDSPDFDTINRGNLNVHLSIPIFSRAGRAGTNFSFALNYDGLVWQPKSSGGTSTWSPAANWGWTTVSNAEYGYVSYKETLGTCTIPPKGEIGIILTASGFVYHDHYGKSHPFTYSVTSTCNGSLPFTGTETYSVTDNSGYTIYRNGNAYVAFTKTGEQYAIPAGIVSFNGHPSTAPTPSGTYTDTNGNQIIASSSGVFTDTLGTTALTVTGSGTASSPMIYQYTDTTGAFRTVTVNYQTYNVATHFGVSGVTEFGGTSGTSVDLVSSIVYSGDGSQYSFFYEQTPGYSTYTGRLAKVTLPTGGSISYTYASIESDGSVSGLTRTTSDGTTTYARSNVASTSSTTTFTDATTAANTTVSNYLEDANGYIYETSRSIYSGTNTGATPLQQVTTCYSQTPTCSTNSVTAPIGYITTTVAQNGTTVATDFKQYNGGFLISDNNGYITETTAYQPFTGVDNIGFARVSSITDKQSAVQIAQTTYSYDQTTPTATSGVPQHVGGVNQRGNLTNISPWLNTTNATFGATTIAYWDTGSPISSTGPTGSTNYSYDTTNSFTTKLTPPTSSSGVVLASSATYDPNAGLPLTLTDPNLNNAAFRSYDALLRPLEIDYTGGGKTTFDHPTPNQSGTYQLTVGSSTTNTQTLLDGYGRISRVAVYNGQSGNDWYQRDTCYDPNGRLQFQSNTYQGTGFSQAIVCSGSGDSYAYDALGRVTTITHTDGTHITYSYTRRATQVTDENGVTRVTQVDGLGRPVSVCEVSSATLQGGDGAPGACSQDIPATGFLTTYSYTPDSAGNQVTQVTQSQQTRVFKTDSLGRTVSIQEPESGTTTYSYVYNSGGLQVTRTRPQANQLNPATLTTTTSQYDALGRIANVYYSDGTPSKQYHYDTNAYWSSSLSPTNLKGRLADVVRGQTASLFSYDDMGSVVGLWSCAPSTCGTANQNSRAFSFGYDYAENLSRTNVAGALATYTLSPADEVTSISTNATSPTRPGQLVSNVLNGPNGPISYTLGNGLNIYNNYDSLGRPNARWVCTGAAQFDCPTQLYGEDVAWQGTRATAMNDTVIGAEANFGYDQLNRISSSAYNYTNSSVQTFGYSYDRYGNRWTQTLTGSGTGPQPSFNFNLTNNQISSGGYTYDAAGNMTSDGSHSYRYDADGNILSVADGAVVYTYDAFNRRVAINDEGTKYEIAFNPAGQRLVVYDGTAGTVLRNQYYWGAAPLAYFTTNTHFQHQDWLGTERMQTSYNGAVEASYTSLPFGDGFNDSSGDTQFYGGGAAEDDAYHFAGLDHDAETDTDHAQFRQYSPAQGRWLAPDPYSGSYDITNPQSFNRYAYVLNNPLSYRDPLGLEDSDCGDDDSCDDGGNGGGGGGGGGGAGGGPDCNGNTTVCVTGNPPSDPNPCDYSNCFPTPGSGSGGGGGGRAKAPTNGGILKQLFCAAANAVGLTSLPGALNSTVGVGAGGSAGIGIYGGVSIGGGVQAVADQQGNVGIAITLQGNPGQGVWGIGASGGGQLMRSNATTIGDLRGTGPDIGASIGDGPTSAGFDFSGSGGTWAGTATVGVGAGLVEHSAGANISKTWLPVSVNCN